MFQIIAPSTIVFSLRIAKVTSDVFRAYILEVENSMGKEVIHIQFIEGMVTYDICC